MRDPTIDVCFIATTNGTIRGTSPRFPVFCFKWIL